MQSDLVLNSEKIITNLKDKNLFPQHVDVTMVGIRYWVACYDFISDSVMDDLSTTGFANDPQVAMLKALSERVERDAFRSGHKNKIKACMTERSDGFAAYPKFYSDANIKVKESALSEAMERYVWGTWWDNKNIAFEAETIQKLSENEDVLNYLSNVKSECNIGEVFVIIPKIKNETDKKVFILIGHLKNGGFISGGACGSDMDQTLLRSMDELLRHGLALKKLKNVNHEKLSFYEKRLVYFGFGEGNQLVSARLTSNGHESIELPELEIDQEINTQYEEYFLVHRCLYKNQPPFIGGKLERLCL